MNIGGRLADQRAALERHQRSSEELARAMVLPGILVACDRQFKSGVEGLA
jgi:hypothetical protein